MRSVNMTAPQLRLRLASQNCRRSPIVAADSCWAGSPRRQRNFPPPFSATLLAARTTLFRSLQRLDEILNKIPAKPTPAPSQSKRVTFEATTKPPQEQQPAASRVANETPNPRVINKMPTPRVAYATPTPMVSTMRQPKVKATIDKPILTKERTKAVDDTPGRTRLKEYLRAARDNRARKDPTYS